MILRAPALRGVALWGGVLVFLAACGPGPKTSRALRSAADALAARRYAESEALFQKARAEARTEEERGRAGFGLAEVAYAQGQAEPALALYREVAGQSGVSAHLRLSAQEGVGRALRTLDRKLEAKEALQAFFRQLGRLSDVERLNLRDAELMLPPIQRLEARAGYLLGVIEYEMGDLAAAAAALKPIASALRPGLEQAQAYRILAHARQAEGRLEEAITDLGRAYVVAPAEPPELRCQILETQAALYAQQERTLSAIEALGRAAQLCPQRPAIAEQSEALVAKLGPEDLTRLMQRYPHETPGDIAVLALARTLADQGDLRGAIDRLRQASADYSASPIASQFQDEIKNLELRLVVDPRALGFIGPLSGRLGPVGKEILAGAQMAAGEYNRLHPNDVFRLLPVDTAAGPEADLGALQRLAQEDRVVAVLGPVTTASVQACAQLIEQLGVPALAPSATGEGLAGPRKYLFRSGLLQSQQIRRVVDFAVRGLDLRSFAILYPENRYGVTVRSEFHAAVQTYGGLVVAEASYPVSATDFAEPILRIKAAAPQAVFLPGEPTTVALIAPQIAFHELGPLALLGTNALNTEEVVRIGGKHVEGLYFVDDYFEGSGDPLTRAFVDAFRQAYGRAPSRLAAQGYDAARLLILALAQDGPRANRALLARRLASVQSFQSVTGLSGFDPSGQSVKNLKVLGITDGRIVQVQ
jgi:branched-chain amino acid transport system substrate-binding protein